MVISAAGAAWATVCSPCAPRAMADDAGTGAASLDAGRPHATPAINRLAAKAIVLHLVHQRNMHAPPENRTAVPAPELQRPERATLVLPTARASGPRRCIAVLHAGEPALRTLMMRPARSDPREHTTVRPRHRSTAPHTVGSAALVLRGHKRANAARLRG